MSCSKLAAQLFAALILFILPVELHAQVFVRVHAGTANHLRAVDFLDDSLGLIAGDLGTILRTTDGGLSWNNAPSGTTSHLLCVSWLSPATAIAAGHSGTILRSDDAGQNWTTVPSGTVLPLADCAGWDSLNALVVGYNGIILRSADGGISWSPVSPPGGSNHLGVSYADSLTICVSGSSGRMLRSMDEGVSWTSQSFGTYPLNDVDFIDSMNGIATGSGWNLVLRTTDAGAHWTDDALTGTFDDIDHGSDRSVVMAGAGAIFSDDAGASWAMRELPVRLRGVASFDSTRCLLVGDNGVILRRIAGAPDPPPPGLHSPADGATGVPLSPDWQVEFSLTLSWNDYAAFFPDSVQLQVSDLPDFTGPFLHNSTRRITAVADTQRVVSRVLPGRIHYWRIRMISDGVASPWSETWSFSGGVADALFSVSEIQAVHPDSLALADSLTALARDRWLLQASTLNGEMVFTVLRCVTDPADLYNPYYLGSGESSGQFFYAVDTGAAAAAWRGIKVVPGWDAGSSDLIEAFDRVRVGDLVVCAGVISEDPWMSMNSETSFFTHWLFVIESSGATLPPAPASVTDFFHLSGQNRVPRYLTGEPLEGVYVELTDLTVHSASSGTFGTFNVTGRDGLTIGTADFSRWFTLRSHRDPASGYEPPSVGRPIDTLRGYIATTSGDVYSSHDPVYRIVPVDPGDIVYGAPTGNVVRGSVYYDSNRNAERDPGEPGIEGWRLFLGGLVSATLEADADGSFGVTGLDSGSYLLNLDLPEGWYVSTSGSPMLEFALGLGDTMEIPQFGIYFGWNRVSGTVFDDTNENGSQEGGEPGLPGVRVLLFGTDPDSTITDASGEYLFDRLVRGLDTVRILLPPLWEQIVPFDGGGVTMNFTGYNLQVPGCDFSLRRSPLRTKTGITVRDAAGVVSREIGFGTRPGASYAVWGVNTVATFIDFSEGEFEIPPQIFGLFDARFIDPRGGLESFGEGTWTDIREYRSADQVDSFRIDFQPGLFYGGSYPMRFFWSHAAVESAYSGAVTLGDADWNPLVDMKRTDSLIITDTLTGVLTILTEGPVLRVTRVSSGQDQVPGFELVQNFPNPFNPVTSITYAIGTRSHVSLRIYDVLGREVFTLVDEVKSPGRYLAQWVPGGHPSGVYFCRMTTERYSRIRKMLLVR